MTRPRAPSPFHAFLRGLREAFGAPPPDGDAAAPRKGDAHPYRAPAPLVPSPTEPPQGRDMADLAALIEARHAALGAPHGGVEVVRLDPPGLLTDARVLGARRWFWRYQCRAVIVLEANDQRHALAPMPIATAEGGRVERLPARTWSAAAPSEEIDLAPVLLHAIRRAADAGESSRVKSGLGLLHLMATFTGQRSAELEAPRVVIGDEALELLDARVGRGARPDVRAALTRGAPLAPGAGAGVVALADRVQHIDGTSGGFEAELALVRLDLGGEGLSYGWEIVWSESEEGDLSS